MEILKYRENAQSPWKEVVAIKGEPGQDGAPGKDGEPGAQGIPGQPGADGYTPVKGVDYWTEEEKQEIVDEVLAAGGGTGGGSAEVKVDGTSIIQNEDGTISATVGGGKELELPMRTIFKMVDGNEQTTRDEGFGYFHLVYGNDKLCVTEEGIALGYSNSNTSDKGFDASLEYSIDFDFVDKRDNSVEHYHIECYVDSTNNKKLLFREEHPYFDYFWFWQWDSAIFDIYYQPFEFYNNAFITNFSLSINPTYKYNKVDSNYLPLDSTMSVDGSGNIGSKLGAYLYGTGAGNIIQVAMDGDNANRLATSRGTNSVVFGIGNTLGRWGSFIAGYSNTQSDVTQQWTLGSENRHYSGYGNMCLGNSNQVQGGYTTAIGYSMRAKAAMQTAIGRYGADVTDSNVALVFGVGTEANSRLNGLTLDSSGNGVFAGTVTSTGADYAEYFEWEDGNLENEDRVGYIVALEGDKIRLAQPGDEVLGIISGTVAVLGDNYHWDWKGKYLTDEFGRVIYDLVPKYGKEGDLLGYFKVPRINPEYNEDEEYIPRAERAEWDCVGMFGKLFVRDDGTCAAGGYASIGANGVATLATGKTNIYVMKRESDNVVKVLLK